MKFSELDLHPLLQRNLEKINFVECTPIQADAIPHILKGRDVAGLAQTGTGKTAAFLVPLIDRVLKGRELAASSLTAKSSGPAQDVGGASQAAAPIDETGEATEAELHLRFFPEWRRRHFILILVPTRELAEQVFENAEKLLDGTGLRAVSVYGGTTYDKQKAAFKDNVEFVIATPGRLIDLFKEHVADLRQVRAVVFDEADRMFDMGFKDDMKFILRRIPRERQFLVFSATLNFDVLNVGYEFGAFPIDINVSKDQPKAENVADEIVHLGQEDKPRFLLSLLKKQNPRQGIIFSNFKYNVERIARFLTANGVPAVGISSLLTQAQRNRVMAQFKADGGQNILVATDLAARGLDILGVDLVVNYELPDDPENYVHRIGRTGRAGHKGTAVSLVSDRDVDALARIEDYLGHKVTIGWIDDADLVSEFKPFPREFDRPRVHASGGGDRTRGRERGRGGEQRRSASHPRQGGESPRRHEHRRRQGGGGGGKPRSHQGGRPHHKGPRHGGAPRPAASMAAKPAAGGGLGQMVTGLFKRLFGKSKES